MVLHGMAEVWILGSGISSLAAAFYSIRYAKVRASDVHVLYEHSNIKQSLHSLHWEGPSLEGYDCFADCLPLPISPYLKELLSIIPSSRIEGVTLLDDIQIIGPEKAAGCGTDRTCFVVQREGSLDHLPTTSLKLTLKDRLTILWLLTKKEKKLRRKPINKIFREGFFGSSFWAVWSMQ